MTVTDPATRQGTTGEAREASAGPERRGPWFRALLLRLHFYAGVFVGPFLLVAAISGGLYALAPQLESVVHAEQLRVDDAVDAPLPLSEQVEAALATRPAADLLAVRPAPGPHDTTRVLFADESLAESERISVFVHPGTGEVIDELVVYGTSSTLPFRTWISQLHRHLHLGDAGRIYSELAASWLGIVVLAGVYLWFDRNRRRRDAKGLSRFLRVDRTTSGRARTLSRHSVVGAWATVVLLFLSATGLTWSTYAGANVGELKTRFGWETPTVDVSGGDHAGHGAPAGGGQTGEVDWQQIDAVAAAVDDEGFAGHREIVLPAAPDEAWRVSETYRTWPVEQDVAAVAVHPDGAEAVDVARFDDFPLAAKLTTWGIAAHMGLLFGVVNAVALTLVAAALVAIIVWGYAMWWKRRPTRNARRAGAPAPRGALRRAPAPAVAGVVAVAVAVGWFLPVLGVSLLAFLVVDALLALARRGRPTG